MVQDWLEPNIQADKDLEMERFLMQLAQVAPEAPTATSEVPITPKATPAVPKPAIAAAKATAPKLRLPVKRPPPLVLKAWAAAEAASLPAEAPPPADEDMKDEAPTATSEAPMAISKQPQYAAIPKHMLCCIEGPHRANVDTFLRLRGWNRDGTCNCT